MLVLGRMTLTLVSFSRGKDPWFCMYTDLNAILRALSLMTYGKVYGTVRVCGIVPSHCLKKKDFSIM